MRTRDSYLGVVFLAAALLFGSAACEKPAHRPHDTLKAYVLAIKHKDSERAYELLSKGLKERCSRKQFKRNVQQAGKSSKKKLHKLLDGPKKISFTATVDLGSGEKLVLTKEGESWRVSSDPFVFYGQSTPREALRSFIRALERKRYRVLLRFAPRKWRQRMGVEDIKNLYSGENAEKTKTLISNLKANRENRIEKSGDKAVMLYGDNQQVRFLKEEGVWKISGFE